MKTEQNLPPIKGLVKSTLLDYPGKISAVVFLPGCNFRCPFCHNPDLVLNPENYQTVTYNDFYAFLQKRQGILDGICITGGEPTIYKEKLVNLAKQIKKRGFLVKLDTNGTNFSLLKQLVDNSLVDFVSMDIKTLLNEMEYKKATGLKEKVLDFKAVLASAQFLAKGSIPCEFRTTVVPKLHNVTLLTELAKQLYGLEVRSWHLQHFRPDVCLDSAYCNIEPFNSSFYKRLLPKVQVYIPNVCVRGIDQ